MHFYVLTLFPELIESYCGASILKRAADRGLVEVTPVNIRDFTASKHGRVDDYTYGGGAGMLMQAQPVYDAYASIAGKEKEGKKTRVVFLTPQGRTFTQETAREFAREEELILLCGHYEGIDERVLEEIVTDEISLGDFVLTGGELPALAVIDAVSRLVPGVLNNEDSASTDSFENGLLEYPQYSRPEVWHDRAVPAILLSGDHKKVDEWRLEQSLIRTKERRPELYEAYMEAHPPKPPKRRRKKPCEGQEDMLN